MNILININQRIGVHYEEDYLDKDQNKLIRRINDYRSFNHSSNTYYNSIWRKTTDSSVRREYEILQMLEFDSNRKRMGIIVQDYQTNQIILYCKGADSSIFAKSACNKAYLYSRCLKMFSENGWRTLVLAYRILGIDEYNEYKLLIKEANNDILNRGANLNRVYNKIESGLSVIGVTAVEDKLQEDVDNTLSALRRAGIKIWVLTGDKLETAVNISKSCKHIHEMQIQVLKEKKNSNDIKIFLTRYKQM